MRFQSIEKIQDRIHWRDGTFSDYTILKFPPAGFRFLDIDQREPLVKLKDAAYPRWVKALGRGETDPRIVAFLRLARDRPVSELFPNLHCYTETGEGLFSANSLITHTLRTLLAHGWLRYEGGRWQVIVPKAEAAWRQRGEAVLALLEGEGRLHLEPGPGVSPPDTVAFEDFAVAQNLIPVGRLGFPRDLVWRERPRIAFNTAFFLLEHHDFFSFHSALGEPFGLFVQQGLIQRPPLYRRAALFQRADGSWQNVASNVTVYTRAYGIATHGCALGCTPSEAGRIELTLIDQQVVGWKTGGGLDIPQNEFVLSFAPGVLTPEAQATLRTALRTRPVVSYRFVGEEHQDIVQALQVGPLFHSPSSIFLRGDDV